MERRALKTTVAVALVIVAVFGVWRWRAGSGQQTQQTVQTATVIKATVKPVLTVTGAVAADERKITASSSGEIEEIFVKEGDAVTAGQNLLRLNAADAQSDVNIAWANLKSARARLQELRDKSASASEIAAQDAAVAKANAEYAKADAVRDALTITSPIGGTVIDLAVAVGDRAGNQTGAGSSGSADTGLMTVADLTKLHVKAAIDQADISKVAVGQPAKITLDALPGKEFGGQVTSIDAVPETNQNVVTYSAYISLDKLDAGARLGMSADIAIDLGKKENVLVVPNIAVRSSGESRVVTKMVDGQQTEVTVETGASDSENTEITSGLSANDKIVLQSFTSQTGSTGSFSGSPFGGGSGGQRGGQRNFMMMGGPR